MAETVVRLGDVQFVDFEVPERLPFGGLQRQVVHELPGSRRVVQSFGWEPRPIEWDGTFLGRSALARARAVEDMARSGAAFPLSWHDFLYEVVITTFEASFETWHEVPYAISCTVVRDASGELTGPPHITPHAMVNADAAVVRATAQRIPDDLLRGRVAAIDGPLGAITDVARATSQQIRTVMGPIQAAQRQAQVIWAAANAAIRSATTLGGVLPGNPVARAAGRVIAQATTARMLGDVAVVRARLARMATNLSALETAPAAKDRLVSGGTLLDVAASEYGDARQWQRIARASGMADPRIDDIRVVRVPRP